MTPVGSEWRIHYESAPCRLGKADRHAGRVPPAGRHRRERARDRSGRACPLRNLASLKPSTPEMMVPSPLAGEIHHEIDDARCLRPRASIFR